MDDYKVLTRDTVTGKVTLTPSFPPKKVSGVDKLIQVVVLSILNNPGRNIFYPEQGSGIPSLVGSNISLDDTTETLGEISERIEKAKDEIIAAQNSLENEDSSERLADIIVLNVESGTQIDEVEVTFRVISEAGDTINLVI